MTDHSDFDLERPRIVGRYGSHPVVDLNGVPEEHWVEVLSRFHPSTHGFTMASYEPPDQATLQRALVAAGQASLEYRDDESVVADEAWAHPPGVPTPTAEPESARARRGHRQVNFRLSRDHYGMLGRAAELLDMTPTTLAGLLVVRGVDQILREARPRA